MTPFLLRAVGSSARIDAAFATAIDKYRNARGVNFYSNDTPASVPASLAPRRVIPVTSVAAGITLPVSRHRVAALPLLAVSLSPAPPAG